MSGLSWLILTLALMVGAVYGTVKVHNAPVPQPLQLEESAKSENDASHKGAARGEKEKPPAPAVSGKSLPANANLDDLWRQTLFLPTRTEDTGEDNAGNAAEAEAQAARNIEFELVGIAQINVVDAEEPAPVAILRSKVGSERASRARGARRGNPRDRNSQNNVPAPSGGDDKSKGEERQVFRVGEKINQTGYVLTSIDLESKMVEVSRNGETVKLYINFAGPEAIQRREAANQVAEQKRQEQARRLEQENRARLQAQNPAQPNATPANPGVPPGPPGSETAPGGAASNMPSPGGPPGVPPSSPDARAERLRRIAEARQARQQQSQNAGGQSNAPSAPAAEPTPAE